MARVKVRLADNIARVVFLETNATEGAELGVNVRLNGQVATPEAIRAWLGATPTAPAGGGGITSHRLLQGLTLGNDHPQYPLKAGTETIAGNWNFTQRVDINNDAGLRIINQGRLGCGLRLFVDGSSDRGTNATMEWREGPEDPIVYGFRMYMDGAPANEAYLDMIAHDNDATGARVFRISRSGRGFSELTLVTSGTLAAPTIRFVGDPDLGIYNAGTNTLGLAATNVSLINALTNVAETNLSIRNRTNSGFEVLSFDNAAGTRVMNLGYGNVSSSLPQQGFLNMVTGSDFLFRTSGVERWRLAGTGAMGFSGANYGTVGQVLTSGGGSVPPSWQDPAGGPEYIGELLDVDDYGAQVSDVLTWDGTRWIPLPPPGASGGEANTGANLGTGQGVYAAKVAQELRFRSLVAGTGISLSSDANEITIAATGGGGGGAEPDLFRVLESNATGSNVNTAQPWFPTNGAVTVDADSTYEFEGILYLTSGTTSHSVGVSFGGTATITGIQWNHRGLKAVVNNSNATQTEGTSNTAGTNRISTAANTTAGAFVRVHGTVRFSAGGTFIPQFQYSAAPGSSTVRAGTYFKMTRLGNAAVTSKGTWA